MPSATPWSCVKILTRDSAPATILPILLYESNCTSIRATVNAPMRAKLHFDVRGLEYLVDAEFGSSSHFEGWRESVKKGQKIGNYVGDIRGTLRNEHQILDQIGSW